MAKTKKEDKKLPVEQSLGELIDIISNIALGDSVSRSNDVLGRVYEYFLGQFALAEGKKGGQFYTPPLIMSSHRGGISAYPMTKTISTLQNECKL